MNQTSVKQAPAWNCHDDSNAVETFGCVLRASEVNGADIGPTSMTIIESPPAGPRSINGYWVSGSDFVIVGKDGSGDWFQLRSNNLELSALGCDKSLPFVSHAAQDGVMLRWGSTATDFWVSNSGSLDIVAFEHNGSTVYAPIQFAL
ncbi:MAG TPA: hypothetical protein PK156_51270, partial [Polyangium sp.]|nr:hypothetical protein [Polyangium sp.]